MSKYLPARVLRLVSGSSFNSSKKKAIAARRISRAVVETIESRIMLAATPIYRINAGGDAITSVTPNWTADTNAAPSQYFVSGTNNVYSTGATIDMTSPTIPAGTPTSLFQTERWEPAGDAEMQWALPVTAGQYTVNLYFAEIYPGAQTAGARKFDVSIENQQVLNDYDVFADVGANKGVVKSFVVNSDATLNIDFAHVIENPALKGIEIIPASAQSNTLGISATTLDYGSVATGGTSTKAITLTNLGAAGNPSITINTTSITGTNASLFTDSFVDGSNIVLAPGASTTFNVSFKPTTTGAKSASLTINHSGSNTPLTVALTGTGAAASPVGFGKSTLTGVTWTNPTSLQWGPDGRLYVSQQNGVIKAVTVARNGANSYAVTATETINLINQMPNRNDDGTLNASVTGRLVTGILVAGTAANPVIYVCSSDPRIGGGGSGTDLNLDTNSGILSKLTKNGATWTKLDLVRGLPRSEENHTANGLAIDPVNNIIYIAQGGNTNMGAPSNNFAKLPEYALSAAILSVNLNQIGSTTYDLPTLDDETRAGVNDANDPFGGNDGLNQAKLVPGGPVQVYSPGFRNPYDIVRLADGRMYTIDNGPNAGWGAQPIGTGGNATNQISEPGVSDADSLHLITAAGYYGGHPNPTRANMNNKFNASNPQSPVSVANPTEGTYFAPGSNGSLTTFSTSTNGLAMYNASNFGGAMKGHLLTGSFNNTVYDIALNAAGTAVTNKTTLFSSVGSVPLDVTTMGDSDAFPGTIWVADHESNAIFVFEPNDYGGQVGGGTGADDPNLDEDHDGYNNHDEILNGTNPLSAGDIPHDWDKDFTSDLLDGNDDNDALPDTSDPFAIDAQNGRGTNIPVSYSWENEGLPPGGILNLGFTGMMSNGTSNYSSLYDINKVTAGGAAGVLTVDEAGEGTALGSANTQTQGFQFGVNATASSPIFTVHTAVVGPFAGLTPQAGQQMGMYFGTGDQDNYFSLVLVGDNGGGIKWIKEVGGVATQGTIQLLPMPGPGAVDLYLEVNPATSTIQASYTITNGTTTGSRINVGTAQSFPASWLTNATSGPAVGVIATSAGPAPTFPVTWDFMEVLPNTANTLAASPGNGLAFGNVTINSSGQQTLTLTNAGNLGDPSITITGTTIAGSGFFTDSFNDGQPVILGPGQSTTINVTFLPTSATAATATLSVAHSGSNTPLTIALSGTGQVVSNGKSTIVVDGGQAISNSSTYNPNAFQITNTSASLKISKVKFDLTTSILPDVVFDPNGTAGDNVGKGFTIDNHSDVGTAVGTFSGAHDGGFDSLEITFTGFDANEFFNFSSDIDPTSIHGSTQAQAGDIGSISGMELSGSTVTITYSDNTTQVVQLYRTPNSATGGKNIAESGAPPKPGISILGLTTPGTTGTTSQTVRVTGPAGRAVQVLVAESGLLLSGIPGGGFDIDPFEANTVLGLTEFSATIGASGFVDVPITLTKSQSAGGNNRIVATFKDADGRTGPLSDTLVVQLGAASNIAPSVNAGVDQAITLPATANLLGTASDDNLPNGTLTTTWTKVSGPGTVTFGNANLAATTATFSVAGSYVLQLAASDGSLTSTDTVAFTVNPAGGGGGGGNGLNATYFDNQDLTGASITRVDPNVNFNWGTGSPDPSIGADTFSARWTGQIQPQFSETYTFYTQSNDGARLYINNQLVVNAWQDQPLTEFSGQIALTAGVKYDIRMEFYEGVGSAIAAMLWSSPSTPKAIIPSSALFTTTATTAPAAPTVLSATPVSSSQINLLWNDNSNNETGFKIERKTGVNGTYAVIATTGPGASTSMTFSNTGLTGGTQYVYRVSATNGAGDSAPTNEANATTSAGPAQSPFGGTPITIAASGSTTLQAENYDNGGEGVAYHDVESTNLGGQGRLTEGVDVQSTNDTGGGTNVGWAKTGEWVEYTVNVASGGTYSLGFRVSNQNAGGTFHLGLDDASLGGSITMPNTGSWTTWQTLTVPNLALPTGQHVFRINMDNASANGSIGNFNFITFTRTGAPPAPALRVAPLAAAATNAVTSFSLINTATGQPFAGYTAIPEGATINLATLGTTNVAIRANTDPGDTGSVRFALDGNSNFRVESALPYAMHGDTNGVFAAWPNPVGSHTLTGTPYSGANATGTVGTPLTLHFTIVNQTTTAPTVSSFSLINADTGQPIAGFDPIAAGATIDLATVGAPRLSIRANTNPASVGSVRFGFDSNANFRGENMAPYSLNGDNTNGSYVPMTFDIGSHTVSGTAFAGQNQSGASGATLSITFTVKNSTTTSAWMAGKTMPISLGEVASGVINGIMYLVGEGNSATLGYNIANNTWVTNLAVRPFVGNHHSAEVINGKLYLFGGLDGGSDGKVQIYDPVANSWTTGANMPYAGGSIATALINGIVYAAGGIIGTTTTNLAAKYNPATNIWTSIASMPQGRNHTAASTDGTKLYTFGGRTGANAVANGFNTVEIYDPATNTWQSSENAGSTIAPLPQARGGTGKAVFYNGEFYVMGGETTNGSGATNMFVYNRVDIYKPSSNTWRLGTPMPTARHGIFPVLSGTKIYVAGGGTHSGNSQTNVLDILSLV